MVNIQFCSKLETRSNVSVKVLVQSGHLVVELGLLDLFLRSWRRFIFHRRGFFTSKTSEFKESLVFNHQKSGCGLRPLQLTIIARSEERRCRTMFGENVLCRELPSLNKGHWSWGQTQHAALRSAPPPIDSTTTHTLPQWSPTTLMRPGQKGCVHLAGPQFNDCR